MKILHVYKIYHPDDYTGIPRAIYDLAVGMPDVESHVLTTSTQTKTFPYENHIVHQAKRLITLYSMSVSVPIIKYFRSLIKTVDLIHYHFPWPWMDLLHLINNVKIPSVVTYHSDIVRQKMLFKLYYPVMKIFLSHVNCIVATSPNYMKTSPYLRFFSQKTTCIPIGLPERNKPSLQIINFWRQSIGEKFFLFVGTLRYYKGISYLLKAAQKTGLPVVMIGKGEIPKSAPNNVLYLGVVSDDDRESLLELCCALIFPSHLRSEAFGLSLVEAARAGKPMISCEIGTGTTFINQNNKTGYVIKPKDSDSLAFAMRSLWDNDQISREFGKNARLRFEKCFKREFMCRDYQLLYSHLINNKLS